MFMRHKRHQCWSCQYVYICINGAYLSYGRFIIHNYSCSLSLLSCSRFAFILCLQNYFSIKLRRTVECILRSKHVRSAAQIGGEKNPTLRACATHYFIIMTKLMCSIWQTQWMRSLLHGLIEFNQKKPRCAMDKKWGSEREKLEKTTDALCVNSIW